MFSGDGAHKNAGVNIVIFGGSDRVKCDLSKIVQLEMMSNVERLAMAFGCKVSSLPMAYLGLPLGSHFKAGSMWIDIIDRMER